MKKFLFILIFLILAGCSSQPANTGISLESQTSKSSSGVLETVVTMAKGIDETADIAVSPIKTGSSGAETIVENIADEIITNPVCEEIVDDFLVDNINESNSTHLYPVYVHGYIEFINNEGEVITNYKFDSAGFMQEEMAIVKRDGLYGALDCMGVLKVPFKYIYMESYSCGLSLVKDDSNRYGYIDKLGEIVIPCEYSFARSFSEDIAIVSAEGFKNSIFLFIDKTGNVIGQGVFNNPHHWGDFHNGLMVNGYAYYNINGERVIDNNFDFTFIEGRYPGDFHEGLALYPLLKDEFIGSFDFLKDDIMQFFQGKNWYTVFIDKNGNNVFNKKFDMAGNFSEGLAVAEIDGKSGCIDKTGEFIYNIDNIMPNDVYSEGYINFRNELDSTVIKCGFLDKQGNVAIPAIYDDIIKEFTDGLALVELDGKLIYINYSGEAVFEFNIPETNDFYYFL